MCFHSHVCLINIILQSDLIAGSEVPIKTTFNDHPYLRKEIRFSFDCMHFAFFSIFAFTLKKKLRLFPHVNTCNR